MASSQAAEKALEIIAEDAIIVEKAAVNVETMNLQQLRTVLQEGLPPYFLQGPYKFSTKMFLFLSASALVSTRYYLHKEPHLFNHDPEHPDPSSWNAHMPKPKLSKENLTRIFKYGSIYGLAVWGYMISNYGMFVMGTYTIQSWTWTTIRWTCTYLYLKYGSQQAENVAEFSRYVSLVQNTVTFIVWWFLLSPFISTGLLFSGAPDKAIKFNAEGARRFKEFWKWNVSSTLLTVHGINLPFAILGHILVPRSLDFLDLWNSFAVVLGYLVFYLGVLDRNKLPIYPIFTPRSNLGAVSMTTVLGIYVYLLIRVNRHTAGWVNMLNSLLVKYNLFQDTRSTDDKKKH